VSKNSKGNKRNGGESVETATTADAATVDTAEDYTGGVVDEALPPVEAPAQPSAKVAEGAITLTRKNTHRNGYHVYGADGIRGSLFVSKSLIVGDAPETISVSSTPTGEGATVSGLVYIDPEVAAKKKEQREAREKRKETLSQRRAERKVKAEARLAKIQAQLDKLKATEAKEAAKNAQKAAGDVPTGGETAEGEASSGQGGVDNVQPFTDAPAVE
jgi:hypothetical protein